MKTSQYERAGLVMPSGVNSPVRAFKNVNENPVYIKKATGCLLTDTQGNVFKDYCLGWGTHILGHNSREVVGAIKEISKNGLSFGYTSQKEIELAELIVDNFSSIDKVRFTNSGTEAVMTAVKLARAATSREKIVKFDGCYHGHSDEMLADAGSAVAENSISGPLGVTRLTLSQTVSLPYNDINAFKKFIDKNYREIAAVIVEPVAGNMGLILPQDGFLELLREKCSQYDIVLIFDEVISGFRVSMEGAQGCFGVFPDITVLGKILGGGLPCGAVGAKSEIMNLLAPSGAVYQAGTFSGNIATMTTGLAVLKELFSNRDVYSKMAEIAKFIADEINRNHKNVYVASLGSMFTIFHSPKKINNFEDAKSQSISQFQQWFTKLFNNNILIPPAMFETSFVSTVHTEDDALNLVKAIDS